ncbi:MAG: hypothetical protein ACOCUH_03300 [Bacteriovoracia bacterium]
MRTFLKIHLLSILAVYLILPGCSSYERFKYITEEFELPSRIFKADYNQTWQAVLQVAKNYDIAHQNQEAGILKTRWMDNTQALNFTESFDKGERIKAAKFKLIINVVKGFRGSREVSKVTIYKRQLIEQDFLQGWKERHTDGIMEKTLLYQIERKIWIDNKLKEIDKAREQQQLQAF